MLSFCLHAADAGDRWSATPTGWSTGRSEIKPYLHPSLHAVLRVSPSRTAVLVRERVHGLPAPEPSRDALPATEHELDRALGELRAWPLDVVELVITRRDGAVDVKLRAGRWGTAPVYLLARDGVLHGDWNVTRLYRHLRSAALDPGFAAQYLLGLDHPYSRRTIFPEIQMLTERASAAWVPPFRAVAIRYPHAEANAEAQRVRRGAKVTGAFREILAASMRRWLPDGGEPVAVELSGGLDSSTVAATAAAIASQPVRSFGMMMPGAISRYQRRRRDEVVRRFGLVDHTLPCIAYPPFGPGSRRVRDDAVVPWGEFYDEAVGAMLERARAGGVRRIFTGMGGDELCSYQHGELGADDDAIDDDAFDDGDDELAAADATRPPFVTRRCWDAFADRDAQADDPPQSVLYRSTLESAAAVSTLYLELGVWPISPLCTPELVEFCRRLPVGWRHERVIQRRVLRAFGCSPVVTHPRQAHLENFCDVMQHAMRDASSSVVHALFRSSRLADHGLVDQDALLAAYQRYQRGDSRHADQLLGAAVLELTIRSVERQLGAHERDASSFSASEPPYAGRAAMRETSTLSC
jgi:asparagine synthase (glutamine-hydrolysing)